MTCRRCQELLSQHLDGDLSPRRIRAVDQHLAGCAVCSAVRGELAALCGVVSSLPRHDPGDALWGRIDAALDADERAHDRRRWRWPVLVPAVGGAALLATVGVSQVLQAGARRKAEAVDVALRSASNQSLHEIAERYAAAELEAERLTADPHALRSPDKQVAGGPDGHGEVEPDPSGFEQLDQQLAARSRRLLDRAEAALAGAGDGDAPLPVVEMTTETMLDVSDSGGGSR